MEEEVTNNSLSMAVEAEVTVVEATAVVSNSSRVCRIIISISLTGGYGGGGGY